MSGEWECQQQGVEMLEPMKKKKEKKKETPQQQGAPERHFLLTTAKETFNYQHYTGKKKDDNIHWGAYLCFAHKRRMTAKTDWDGCFCKSVGRELFCVFQFVTMAYFSPFIPAWTQPNNPPQDYYNTAKVPWAIKPQQIRLYKIMCTFKWLGNFSRSKSPNMPTTHCYLMFHKSNNRKTIKYLSYNNRGFPESS